MAGDVVVADDFKLSIHGRGHTVVSLVLREEPPCACDDQDGDSVCDDADNCPATPNPGQEDADGDGIGDACEACTDGDGDGACDDVDNCPDEPNPTQDDADADGIGDACDACPLDVDNDADADGACGDVDNCPLAANPTQGDADGDGFGDACDACPSDPANDADGDGVCGDVDNCPGDPNPSQADGDGDGRGDACDACPFDATDDADGDAVCGDVDNCPATPNPAQEDTDGDGVGDACDACPFDPDDDVDGDGVCGDGDNCLFVANPAQTDADGDGLGDACDTCPRDSANDVDSDGFCGDVDNCPFVANPTQQDVDGDGFGDACDACPHDSANDADGDGVCGDVDNCAFVANPTQEDVDGDGFGDVCDACPRDSANDADGDGVCGDVDNCTTAANPSQQDADGDGLGDACDACPLDSANDVDGDGFCGDVDNCPFQANPAQEDSDGDGFGDACDVCPLDAANDADADGICGDVDNCPYAANPSQGDVDADGFGDACDACPLDPENDADGDGVCGDVDNCPDVANPGQEDADGDGVGDACQLECETGNDADGDGICDEVDNCTFTPNTAQEDADADGAGDACDFCPFDPRDDEDFDGRCAEDDNCPRAYNPEQTDGDGDGIGDACDDCPDDPVNDPDGDRVCASTDNCPGTANFDQRDLDRDGLGDPCDVDADADGSLDPADCNDLDPEVSPLSPEQPENGIDDNCDGEDEVTETLPPDPSLIATSIDPTVPTDIYETTRFLFEAEPPVQAGVADGAIDPLRAAVVRGTVRARDGGPLPNVVVTVLDHRELGHTKTRADGAWDMVVNGGGGIVVRFTKAGFLEAQRHVAVDARNWSVVSEVALVPLGGATVLASGATELQIARGAVESDADGSRQATLIVKSGTTFIGMRNGDKPVPLPLASIRLTEYTVGVGGPQAMPAELPATSGYTYAVEVSVDEARSAGADRVLLSQPAAFYVENFLDAPIGLAVPVGFYDRRRAAWLEERDGIVVAITGEDAGRADLDVDGDGTADDDDELLALGIDPAERDALGALYDPGVSLWRLSLSHFSAVDPNYPWRDPAPDRPRSRRRPRHDNGCERNPASTIDILNRALEEEIPIVGTGLSLVYRSDRASASLNTMEIPLTGPSVDPALVDMNLQVVVAGQTLGAFGIEPAPNLVRQLEWDGRDAYGRLVQGTQFALATISYNLDTFYWQPGLSPLSFGGFGAQDTTWHTARANLVFEVKTTHEVGSLRAAGLGLGGFTVNREHVYDADRRALFMGDGTVRSRDLTLSGRFDAIAGGGEPAACPRYSDPCGDGGFATAADLPSSFAIASMSDGSVLIAGGRVRRVRPDGIIEAFAGFDEGSDGDGGDARDARVCADVIAVGEDDSVYIAGRCTSASGIEFPRVRKITPDGVIATIGGLGVDSRCQIGEGGFPVGDCGDGGPAIDATFDSIESLAVGPDGNVYVGAGRIRRISPAGNVFRYFGAPIPEGEPFVEDDLVTGVSALEVRGYFVPQVAVLEDASVIFGDRRRLGLYKVDNGGTLHVLSQSDFIDVVAAGRDGTIFVRRDGLLQERAADGTFSLLQTYGATNSDGGYVAAQAFFPISLAVRADGSLVVGALAGVLADRTTVFNVADALPGLSFDESAVPSLDGRALFVFDPRGQHLRTLDARTNNVLLAFGRDANGLLTTITDQDGLVTTFERAASGDLQAAIGPYGDRTEIALDDDGLIGTIDDEAGRVWQFSYDGLGHLEEMIDARGNSHRFTYAGGLLFRDEDAAGGFVELTSSDDAIVMTTSEGREQVHQKTRPSESPQIYQVTHESGLVATETRERDGRRVVAMPDGTLTTTIVARDPQLGLAASFVARRETMLPSALTRVTEEARSKVVTAGELVSETRTLALNGKETTIAYDVAMRTTMVTSPEGRVATRIDDAEGRPVTIEHSGLAPIGIEYDGDGRPETLTEGAGSDARVTTLGYASDGRLETITDSEGRITVLARDPIGRVTEATLPGSRRVALGYNEGDNVTSVTPPGKPAHEMEYTPVNLLASTTAPAVGAIARTTTWAYNSDRQLTTITRPSGDLVTLVYDTAGRLETTTFSEGTLVRTYSSTTGQLTSIVAPGGVGLTFSYDGFLPVSTTWSGPVAGTVTRHYNNDLLVDAVDVNGADFRMLAYDDDLLLTGADALTILRDTATGLVHATTVGSVTTSTAYNAFSELVSMSASFDSAALIDLTYTRDTLGRITTKTEEHGGVTTFTEFFYDDAGRLEEVLENGVSLISANFDANGNRTSIADSFGSRICDYDDQDRLVACGDIVYSFNDDGDLVSKTSSSTSETTSYAYDSLGNLRRVDLPDGRVVEYIVDGLNRRVGKKIDGVIVKGWLYESQLRPIAELDGAGNVVSRFVYGDQVNVPELVVRGSTTYRILHDHLGSPLLIVDSSSGAVVAERSYDSWGNTLVDTGAGFIPFGFAGGLVDDDTGLVHFGARDYEPATARFVSKDPLLFGGGTNLYGYVLGDPVNIADPAGMVCREVRTSSRSLRLEQVERVLEQHSEYISDPSCPSGTAIEHCELTALFTDSVLDVTITYEPSVPGEVCPPTQVVPSVVRRGTRPFFPPPAPDGTQYGPDMNFRCEVSCYDQTVCMAD